MKGLFRGETPDGKTVFGNLLTKELMTCFSHSDKKTQHYIITRRGIDWGLPYEYTETLVLNNSVSAYTGVDIADTEGYFQRVFENDVLYYDGEEGIVKYDDDLCRFKVDFKNFSVSLNRQNANRFIYVREAVF